MERTIYGCRCERAPGERSNCRSLGVDFRMRSAISSIVLSMIDDGTSGNLAFTSLFRMALSLSSMMNLAAFTPALSPSVLNIMHTPVGAGFRGWRAG
eukprot:3527507-Rhodomonas_salina.1